MTKIFHKIDVETSWFHIPVPSGNEPSNSPSAPPVSSPGVHLSISIYPQSMAKPLEERLANMDHVFGFAPRTEDEAGRWIYIFYHRVEELVQKQRLLEHKARILGLAMAHEIGHLLLPFHSHSPRGIMRARWDRQDFQLATYGNLGFTPMQAELIRSEVQRKGGLDVHSQDIIHKWKSADRRQTTQALMLAMMIIEVKPGAKPANTVA